MKKKFIKKEKKEKKLISYTDTLIPIVNFDEKLKVGVMADGTLVDCMKIICKDLANTDMTTQTIDVLNLSKLFSTYDGDLKITSSYFPVDTAPQKRYFERLLEETENPIYKEFLEEEILKCKSISEEFLNREFLIYFYSKNNNEYRENLLKIEGLNNGSQRMVEPLSEEKKIKHFFLLANKNLNR